MKRGIRQVSDSSARSSNSPSEPYGMNVKPTSTTEEILVKAEEFDTSCHHLCDGSTAQDAEGSSQDLGTSSRQPCDGSTAQEAEGSSQDIGTSSRQSCDDSTAEVCSAALQSPSEAILSAVEKPGTNGYNDSEKCPICWATFGAQDTGTPDCCDHYFCTGCLEEWAVTTNTCPVDRQMFNAILVRHYPEGEIIRRIPVRSPREQVRYEALSSPDMRFCEVCGELGSRHGMNYCPSCTLLCHPECVRSLREHASLEETWCPVCAMIVISFEVFKQAWNNIM
jgi:hypothetical protein